MTTAYQRYRSYGHGPFVAFTLASPIWLWIGVFPVALAALLFWIMWMVTPI